jgi:hypothetical protein
MMPTTETSELLWINKEFWSIDMKLLEQTMITSEELHKLQVLPMKKFKNTIEVRRLNSQVEEFKTLVINRHLTISSMEVTKEDTDLHLIEPTATLLASKALTEAQTPLAPLIEAQIEVQFIVLLQVVVVDMLEILLDKIIESYQ